MDKLNAERILDAIPACFDGLKADARAFRILYKLKKSDGSFVCRTVVVGGGVCEILCQSSEDVDLTIRASEQDYLRIATGRLNLEIARWCGNIKYVGNNLLHLELNTYLSPPDSVYLM